MIRSKNFINRLKAAAEALTVFAIDIISVLVIFKLSLIIRQDLLPSLISFLDFPKELPFSDLTKIWWIFLAWVFFFYYEGLYTKRFSFWDEIGALWKVSFFSTVSIFTIASIGKFGGEISRTVIILMGMIATVCFPVIRMSSKRILRRLGFLKRRVLILGAGETGRLIAKALKREPNYGYEVVGFLDDDPEKVGRHIEGIKIHRGVDRAINYTKRCNVRDIFIAMPGAKRERLQGLINRLQHKVERVLFVPDMFGMAALGTSLHHFFHEQAFALEIRNNLERPLNIFIKRCFDFIMAGLSMLFLSIPMLIISILIRAGSEGPAIFSQERTGRRGRTFRCYKFRTMYNDAEERLERLLASDEGAREEWNEFWKLKDDPRVTRIGKFLRKTSLDELPQLFNVLMGEMSLVGPRPYLPKEVEQMGKRMDICFGVPPGITGLWQVSGRSSTGYDYRIALDSWYVRNWNLWLDIVILFKTIRVVLKREGAY